MALNPFDWTGPAFLTLYGFGLAAAVAGGSIIPAWLRAEGREGRTRDVDELAYLAGGVPRLADATVARLVARGAVAEARTGQVGVVAAGDGRTAAERGVLALIGPVPVAVVERAVAPAADAVERRLVAAGLLIDRDAAERVRRWQTMPYLVLMAFGAIKLLVGVVRDRPVGYLALLLLLTAALAWLRWREVDRRTRAGDRLLRDGQAGSDRLRRAPTTGEADQAVALFGTAVLAGSALEAVHTLRRPPSDGSDGASGCGGDSGGGDGGCGGGCGGCGS